MATLGELKTRIITETNRDDLQDDLAAALTLCIQRAIDHYADQRFWFNELRSVTTAAANVEYVTIPTNFRFLDDIRINIGGVRYPLTKMQMDDIEELYSVPQVGQPTSWAEYVGQARLWPTPNIAYPLIWLGVANVTSLDYSSDASSNYWTTEAYDLIDARVRFLLYRDYFRDAEGMQIAKAAETEAFDKLKGESNRRIGTGRIKSSW